MTGEDRDTLYVGLDVDRSVCKLYATDADGRSILRRSVAHEDLLNSLPAAAMRIIGLEYRSCAHGLAFDLVQAGYDVRLIRFRDIPQLGNGTANTAFDCAKALCEAIRTKSTRHIPVLAPNQQGRAASQRVKALLKRQRSAILGAARNLAGNIDTEQRLNVTDAQDIQNRLGSVAKTSAFHQASSALLQVLFVLDESIASFERVGAAFDVVYDDVLRTIENKDLDPGGNAVWRKAEAGYRKTYIPNIDQASDMQI